MIDLRYFGLTVISIFLALAVGLTMGMTLNSPAREASAYDALRHQHELLSEQNETVRNENEVLRRRLQAREQALRELIPLAVRGRLAGARVAVVICGDLNERRFWGDLETTLRIAGARLGPIVRIPDDERQLPPDARARLAAVWGASRDNDEPEPHDAAAWIVRGLARVAPRHRLEELARETGLQFRGDYSGPVRRLLVLTEVDDFVRAEQLAAADVPEIRVVEAAREEGLLVVAAEPENTAGSAVEPLRRRGVTTVDGIDTSMGQIGVVLALAGQEGHFGSKPGATRAIPELNVR